MNIGLPCFDDLWYPCGYAFYTSSHSGYWYSNILYNELFNLHFKQFFSPFITSNKSYLEQSQNLDKY